MKKIMIIEDDATLRDMFRIYLILEGYSVFTAQNGEEGLCLLNQVLPHLVLCDYNMPGMNGLEVLQHINTRGPGTPVILITGSGHLIRAEVKRLGAVDLLTKPISRKLMCRAINKVLNNFESQVPTVASPYKL